MHQELEATLAAQGTTLDEVHDLEQPRDGVRAHSDELLHKVGWGLLQEGWNVSDVALSQTSLSLSQRSGDAKADVNQHGTVVNQHGTVVNQHGTSPLFG